MFKKSPDCHNLNVHHSQYLGQLVAQADPDQILTAHFNVTDLKPLTIAA
jgi:hypothetical protein